MAAPLLSMVAAFKAEATLRTRNGSPAIARQSQLGSNRQAGLWGVHCVPALKRGVCTPGSGAERLQRSIPSDQVMLPRAMSHHGGESRSTDLRDRPAPGSLGDYWGLRRSCTTEGPSSVAPSTHMEELRGREPWGRPGGGCDHISSKEARHWERRRRGHVTRAVAGEVGVESRTPNKDTDPELVDETVRTIRMLVVDAVEEAQAGHPGLPLGCASLGFLLFDEVMRFNPRNPAWLNRDRFLLSAGHGCLLQYILLHLTGYDLQVDDLRHLCKYESRCPGHPENTSTPGIEITSGPLGQGTANAVGMALAEKHLAARFNRPGHEIIDHYTYCLAGDGCMMEGVSNEAGSLAGHWGLGKLIMFYDDNHNTIDGPTDLAFSEDVCGRYRALGWHVQHVRDPDRNLNDLRDAIAEAQRVTDKPSLIRVSTIIGYGSSKAGTHKAHHGTFGPEEVEKIRSRLNWPWRDRFHVPDRVAEHMGRSVERGASAEEQWKRQLADYEAAFPKEAAALKQLVAGGLPSGWEKALPNFGEDEAPDATRGYSEGCLNALAGVLPGLIGGSADLASSNKVYLHASGDFERNTPAERNIRYGIREHCMAAISNGIFLHKSGLIPFAATFLVFSDYMRAGIRLSALSDAGVLYVCTHDSIGVGEDGPTHQPVEHLVSLRAMPNLRVLRPGDAVEVAGAYKVAISNRKGPTLLALSRQKMETAVVKGTSLDGVQRGGYVVSDNTGGERSDPDLILIGTGAELQLCHRAAERLRKEGSKVRLVSLISWDLFEEQPAEYRQSVLPPHCLARVAVEAGSPMGWREWVGPKGRILGVPRFGASANYKVVFDKYGFTVENVLAIARETLRDCSQ